MRLLDPGDDSINRGLEGFWPLDDGAGTVATDVSPWRRNGALTNFGLSSGTGWGAGRNGKALVFDGSNDYVPVAKIPPITKCTLAVWLKSTGTGANTMVATKNFSGGVVPMALSISSGAGAAVGMSFYNGAWQASGVTTDVSNDGKWHFVAGTYDGATLRYYLDGKLDASAAYTGSLPNNTNPLEIGAYTAGASYFKGTMSGFRLLSRALTPGEIARIYADPWAGTLRRRPVRFYLPPTHYSIAATGITRRYSFGDADLVYTPAAVTGGDTHDGIKRQSRRQRALAAADARRRDEQASEARALRLELEAAMGFAVEAAEEAPAPVVAAVERAAEAARVVLPVLRQAAPDPALLAEARALVATLQAQAAEAERLRALAEDDEEVLMLLRAL